MEFEAWAVSVDDWTGSGSGRGPSAIADEFNRALKEQRKFEAHIDELMPILPRYRFLVVDVRQWESRSHPQGVLKALRDMIVNGRNQYGSRSRHDEEEIVRFLFVGGSESIDEWESESEDTDSQRRSLKKDVEFYLRVLQSAGAAHYAHLRELGEVAANTCDDPRLVRSAILALARHYKKNKNGTARAPLDKILEKISKDIHSLFESARRISVFKESGFYAEEPSDSFELYKRLLDEVSILYQLGKRNSTMKGSPAKQLNAMRQERAEMAVARRIEVDLSETETSFEIEEKKRNLSMEWGRIVSGNEALSGADQTQSNTAEEIADLELKLARYWMFRDLGRVMSVGALDYLKSTTLIPIPLSKDEVNKSSQRGLFIIDDQLYSDVEKWGNSNQGDAPSAMMESLKMVLGLIDWLDHTVIAKTDILPGDCDHTDDSERFDMLAAPENLRRLSDGRKISTIQTHDRVAAGIKDYALILIDPNSSTDYVGPIRIQQLVKYRQYCVRHAQKVRRDEGEPMPWFPPIVVFSKNESAGYVQQSLNLGAAGYVLKHRPYHLLFEIKQALAPRMSAPRMETGTASQFRALTRLKPHAVEKLRYTEGPAYLRGGINYKEGDIFVDAREWSWIRQLPKSDLHCHMGTCIRFHMVEVLAMNTVGYRIRSLGKSKNNRIISENANYNREHGLFGRVARAVLIAQYLHERNKGIHAMEALAAGAYAVRIQQGVNLHPQLFGLGDAIVRALTETNDRCPDFLVTALLVATIARISKNRDKYIKERLFCSNYLDGLARSSHAPSGQAGMSGAFSAKEALHHASDTARLYLQNIAFRWHGTFDSPEVVESFSGMDGQSNLDYWKHVKEQFEKRLSEAEFEIDSVLEVQSRKLNDESEGKDIQCAQDWLVKNVRLKTSCNPEVSDVGFTLEGCVALPHAAALNQPGGSKGLLAYLRGADLLGSAHLQYPDNLLLAGLSLVEDNALDNVIYCEVRCETIGYSRAGMSALHATDMLRYAFDLACLWLAGEKSLPIARTNILLAAKRHKDERKARDSVALMQSYLDSRSFNANDSPALRSYGQAAPDWWRPCDVVGFDISGNEAEDAKWLESALEPLAVRSSPITIHAGEAANASSIWKAVYSLNATRIGHGLKLAEDVGLLGYCVREGICMEMCPNSNAFTNDFDTPENGEFAVHHYPLRHYMRSGMEVALGTDNRYLHPPKQRTLTSEYITAAQMSGGLTRWEVLQIVKAGFKNAFLEKHQIKALVQEMEDRIYRIVAKGWV